MCKMEAKADAFLATTGAMLKGINEILVGGGASREQETIDCPLCFDRPKDLKEHLSKFLPHL